MPRMRAGIFEAPKSSTMMPTTTISSHGLAPNTDSKCIWFLYAYPLPNARRCQPTRMEPRAARGVATIRLFRLLRQRQDVAALRMVLQLELVHHVARRLEETAPRVVRPV